MAVENYRVGALRGIFDGYGSINGSVHFLVMDTAPSAGGLQENALYAADVLLVPAAVDHLALEGVAAILSTLEVLGRAQDPVVRILPTFYDETTKESQVNLDKLTSTVGSSVGNPIHRATVLRECAALGRTIFEHAPDHRAAEEYARVVWDVLAVGRV
jgi:chromosome partitioning protein